MTDDNAGLKEQLEVLSGERMAALEALGGDKAKEPEVNAARDAGQSVERTQPGAGRAHEPQKTLEPRTADRDLGL